MNNNKQHIPQGYKPSPLGPIPEDWEVKKLGDLYNFRYGDGNKNPHNNGEYPIYGANGIIGGYTKYNAEDSVVIGHMGEYAGSVIWAKGKHFVTYNGTIATIKDKQKVEDKFGYFVLQNSNIKKICAGSGQPFLSYETLNKISITIPTLPEQHRIVSVLQLWDTAIAKQTALIEQLTLRKRGLMQQLLTGKKRLKGFSGEWKRIKAGEIFKSISVKGNGSEVLLSATQEHGVIPRDQLEGRVTMPTGDTNSFKLVEVGDFVISLRSFQGGLEYSEHRGIVSPAYTVLKPIIEIDKSFYRYYFKSADFIGHLAIAVIGIRDGKQISYDDFCFVKIPYPNIKEQKAISSVLLQADKEIEIQKQKLAAMQEQKKGLMQVLLTGKRRIK